MEENKKKTNRKRPEGSGRPRFTEGGIVKAIVVLSHEQHAWLKTKKNGSATVRKLIDQEMRKEQRIR